MDGSHTAFLLELGGYLSHEQWHSAPLLGYGVGIKFKGHLSKWLPRYNKLSALYPTAMDCDLMFGHSSASSHWKMQRLSSIALLPLTLWFIIAVASRATADYTAVSQWISEPLTISLLTLFIIIGCQHAILGIQVVLEDYVNTSIFSKIFPAIRILLILAAALSLIAILKIALENL